MNQPIDILSFFNVSVLASLWRIISGEHLKAGDPKLEKLVNMVQKILEEFGNPLVGVSMNYEWLFKTLNDLGIIILQPYLQNLLKFSESVLTDQKGKLIDGNNILFINNCFETVLQII